MLNTDRLRLRLLGPFLLTDSTGCEIRISSRKQKIILALLVTAPTGCRERAYIENLLWSLTGKEQAQGNLRQAVLGLRRALNADGREIVFANNVSVWIDLDKISIIGTAENGEFLEGINLPHELGFNNWVRTQRHKVAAGPAPPEIGITDQAETDLKPTIAVLPFSSLSEENGKIIGDMVSESVTSALSRSNLIDVISHLSSRVFNSSSVSLVDIRDILKPDYVVTGRLSVKGDAVDIETEIADVSTGHIRGGYQDRFSLEAFLTRDTNIIDDVASAIGRSLFGSSLSGAQSHPLNDVACHDLMMSGVFLMHQMGLAGFSTARLYLEEVARRVPNSALPLAWLSKWYVLSVQQGWSTDFAKDSMIAQDYAARALDINPACSFSLSVDGFVQNNLLKNYDEAMQRFDQALALDPNNPLSWLLKGTLNAFMDLGEEAVYCTDRARKLSPLDPHKYFFDSLSATAALSKRDYGSALRLADRSLQSNTFHTSTIRVKTIALERLGRHEEAAASARKLLKLDPTLTIQKYLDQHPAANFRTGRDWADALKSAGIPLR